MGGKYDFYCWCTEWCKKTKNTEWETVLWVQMPWWWVVRGNNQIQAARKDIVTQIITLLQLWWAENASQHEHILRWTLSRLGYSQSKEATEHLKCVEEWKAQLVFHCLHHQHWALRCPEDKQREAHHAVGSIWLHFSPFILFSMLWTHTWVVQNITLPEILLLYRYSLTS